MATNSEYTPAHEQCFYCTYGRENTIKDGGDMYCLCGEKYFIYNNQRVPNQTVCWEWENGNCKKLQKITGITR